MSLGLGRVCVDLGVIRSLYICVGLLVGLVSASCSGLGGGEVELARDGKSDYVIVVADSVTGPVTAAAGDLQKYLALGTTATLPIVRASQDVGERAKIVLQVSDLLPETTVSIGFLDRDIWISGGSESSVRNAVYEFMERYLGYRRYAPDGDLVPKTPVLKIRAEDYEYTPPITTRTVHSSLFYDNPGFADWHKLTHEAFPGYVKEARVHTFQRFIPEIPFYASHPAYFALRDGVRLPTQLCLTNPDVLRIVKDSVAALFARDPEASVISVSQNDNQQYCQCDRCKAVDEEEGSPSGTVIRFVNRVAEAFPDRTISTLAYQYTRKPCKTVPLANVLITLCSIECDRSAPIFEKCPEFSADLQGWAKLTHNIRVWDYTTQFTNFLAPFPNLRTLQPNLRLFRDDHARWVFEQHSYWRSDLFELRSYVLAKLLWDPDQDFEALLTDFTNGYYGPAGKPIKAYIQLMHDELAKDKDYFLFLYGDPSEAFGSYLSSDLLERYSVLFDEAARAVAQDSALSKRVRSARLGLDYAILEASRKNISKQYALLRASGDGQEGLNRDLVKKLDDFVQNCKENGVQYMNEMGFSLAEYSANYVATLENAKKANKALGKKVISLTPPKKYAGENPGVLTDGAQGGSSFYANWLGYEGEDMEVVVDLGNITDVSNISTSFLQVTNHVVFFPEKVSYYGSVDNGEYTLLKTVVNPEPLTRQSKANAIQRFQARFDPVRIRYVKLVAQNVATPYWHNAAGLPSWLFTDEIIVN